VPRIVESHAVQQRLEAEDVVHVSELARPELMAVFHRRWREGKWSQADFTAAVRQFSADITSGVWSWLPVDATIMEPASKIYTALPEAVFFRTADCLHLVTVLHHNIPEIFTHDKHQTAAAAALGITPITITPRGGTLRQVRPGLKKAKAHRDVSTSERDQFLVSAASVLATFSSCARPSRM